MPASAQKRDPVARQKGECLEAGTGIEPATIVAGAKAYCAEQVGNCP